jgi:hypothetical protein
VAGYACFDEYWSAFVLEHWQRTSRRRRLIALGKGLAQAALGVLSPRLSALAALEPLNLRWAAAATLLSLGKTLAGTMDQEVARVGTIETAGWPVLAQVKKPSAPEEAKQPAPLGVREGTPSDWAVWM